MGIFDRLFGGESALQQIDGWQILESSEQLQEVIQSSHNKPVLIFKHSTRCSISTMAQSRLFSNWDFKEEEIDAWYLDLISFRDLSDTISTDLGVSHKSPQIIMIKDGKAVYNESHGGISVEGIRAAL
ncbi:MAG: bacillithiol system protein YtxJ [Limisphaerales bacterium]|jgi:bacillithiol system protein YtxJ